jgi:hypothetical protein
LRSVPIVADAPRVRNPDASSDIARLQSWFPAPASAKRLSRKPPPPSPAPVAASPSAVNAAPLSDRLAHLRASKVIDKAGHGGDDAALEEGDHDGDAALEEMGDEADAADRDEQWASRNKMHMQLMRDVKAKKNGSALDRRRIKGNSFDAAAATAEMTDGADLTDGDAFQFCSVAERVSSADQVVSYVRALSNPNAIPEPRRYGGVVRKEASYDQDANTFFSPGWRHLWVDRAGGQRYVSPLGWVPKNILDVLNVDILALEGVLLARSGGLLVDLPCRASADIMVNATFSPKHRVQTKLRAMLRDDEPGWARGFFSLLGWIRIGDTITCRIYGGDCREHPLNQPQTYWDNLQYNFRKSIWHALKAVARVTFSSRGSSDPISSSSSNSLSPSAIPLRQLINEDRLGSCVDEFLAIHPNTSIRVEKPLLFFRFLALFGASFGVCVSICVDNFGHKNIPSQTSPTFTVLEDPAVACIPENQMKDAFDGSKEFVQKSWIQSGLHDLVNGLAEAVQCPLRISASFGMYVSGVKHDQTDGTSPYLFALPPSGRIEGPKGTMSRPLALPFDHCHSVTSDAPADGRQLAFVFRRSVGDPVDETVMLSPSNRCTRASQVQIYHPARAFHTDTLTSTVLSRIVNSNETESRKFAALQKVIQYVRDSAGLVNCLRALLVFCSKRFECNFELTLFPESADDLASSSLLTTLNHWIHCTVQLPSLHFFIDAEDMWRHCRMKITCLTQLCLALTLACQKRWVAAVQRNLLLDSFVCPQIYGTSSPQTKNTESRTV